MKNRPGKKRRHIFFWILGIFAGLWLVAEILLRILYPLDLNGVSERPLVNRPDTIPVGEDKLITFCYIPGSKMSFANGDFFINSLGFIGPEIEKKRDDRYRIAIVGSSFVAGHPDVDEYSNFCMELNSLFDRENYNAEVINCGTDGLCSYSTFLSIENKVLAAEPDCILFEFGIPFLYRNLVKEVYNDYIMYYNASDDQGRARLMNEIDVINRNKGWLDFIYHSYVVRAAFRLYVNRVKHYPGINARVFQIKRYLSLYTSRRIVAGSPDKHYFTEHESVVMVRELASRLKEKGISFFLFESFASEENLRIAKENKLPYINLRVELEPNERVHKDPHPNVLGNKKIAGRIYEILTKYKILGEEYKSAPKE